MGKKEKRSLEIGWWVGGEKIRVGREWRERNETSIDIWIYIDGGGDICHIFRENGGKMDFGECFLRNFSEKMKKFGIFLRFLGGEWPEFDEFWTENEGNLGFFQILQWKNI